MALNHGGSFGWLFLGEIPTLLRNRQLCGGELKVENGLATRGGTIIVRLVILEHNNLAKAQTMTVDAIK